LAVNVRGHFKGVTGHDPMMGFWKGLCLRAAYGSVTEWYFRSLDSRLYHGWIVISTLSFADSPSDNRRRVRYNVADLPVTVPSQKPPPDKPNPKQGIGMLNVLCSAQPTP
jgi:hypothetical protein